MTHPKGWKAVDLSLVCSRGIRYGNVIMVCIVVLREEWVQSFSDTVCGQLPMMKCPTHEQLQRLQETSSRVSPVRGRSPYSASTKP
jgi:phospholipid N-methyltransferase